MAAMTWIEDPENPILWESDDALEKLEPNRWA